MSKHKKRQPLTTVQKFNDPIDLYKAFGLTDKEAREIVAVQEIAKGFAELQKEINSKQNNGG